MADLEKTIRLRFEAAGIDLTQENVQKLLKTLDQMPDTFKKIEDGANFAQKIAQETEAWNRAVNNAQLAREESITVSPEEISQNNRVKASRDVLENTQRELEVAKQRAEVEKETLSSLEERIKKLRQELSNGIAAPSDYSLFTPREENSLKKSLLKYNTSTAQLQNLTPDTKAYTDAVNRIEQAKIDFDTTVRRALERLEKEVQKTPEASNVKKLEQDIIQQTEAVKKAEVKAEEEIAATKKKAKAKNVRNYQEEADKRKQTIAQMQRDHDEAIRQGNLKEAKAHQERIKMAQDEAAAKAAELKKSVSTTNRIGSTASSMAGLLGVNGSIMTGLSSITTGFMSLSGVAVPAIAVVGFSTVYENVAEGATAV